MKFANLLKKCYKDLFAINLLLLMEKQVLIAKQQFLRF